MSARFAVYMTGELAHHARGRTLAATFGAQACESLPAAGPLFVFGKEFQTTDTSTSWIAWTAAPGRVLMVIPPYGRGSCDIPKPWEARRTESLAGGETALGKLLASERRHEIRGQLLPLEKVAGQVVTAGWRKHPAAGLVVITALPVWSLTALDHKTACEAWLADLVEHAGVPVVEVEGEEEQDDGRPAMEPTAEEWTLLLHLCTGPFPDENAALDALSNSAIHTLPPTQASAALDHLTERGLIRAGTLTPIGERMLLDGPYAVYARALRRHP